MRGHLHLNARTFDTYAKVKLEIDSYLKVTKAEAQQQQNKNKQKSTDLASTFQTQTCESSSRKSLLVGNDESDDKNCDTSPCANIHENNTFVLNVLQLFFVGASLVTVVIRVKVS